jgi:hypothetical protein
MKTNEQIEHCNHCGNRTSHKILHVTTSREEVYNTKEPSDRYEIDTYYVLTKCKTCDCVSLFCDYTGIGDISESFLVYPIDKSPREHVPKKIGDSYREALKVEKLSPKAYAILMRQTLELLCKDRSALGRNLAEQIKYLASKQIIPTTLAEMSDTLRILGNIGAHGDDYQFDPLEIAAMKDFINATLEYVYVAPATLEKVKESIKKKTGKT